MAKDGKAKSALAQHMVTILHGTNDSGHIWAAPEFSPGYEGPEVTIDIDPAYTGSNVEVPPDNEDHIYGIVGPGLAGGAVPADANVVLRINCAGPG